MSKMSDELLVESYFAAKKFKLSPEFINLLELEIRRRYINIEQFVCQ